ncbi:MAG TPA: hypothetical protein VNV39_03035 [Stellaceae bacterium]|jgi:hypothetical protein|nr:hypothetical protein [Stellaceae bacterium]
MSDDDKQRAALANLDAVARAFPAKVDAMKTRLAAWVAANTGPGNDDAAFTNALLELGMERLLEYPHADENAAEELENISKPAKRILSSSIRPEAMRVRPPAPRSLPARSSCATATGCASTTSRESMA